MLTKIFTFLVEVEERLLQMVCSCEGDSPIGSIIYSFEL
jgi:hypothetical protein